MARCKPLYNIYIIFQRYTRCGGTGSTDKMLFENGKFAENVSNQVATTYQIARYKRKKRADVLNRKTERVNLIELNSIDAKKFEPRYSLYLRVISQCYEKARGEEIKKLLKEASTRIKRRLFEVSSRAI